MVGVLQTTKELIQLNEKMLRSVIFFSFFVYFSWPFGRVANDIITQQNIDLLQNVSTQECFKLIREYMGNTEYSPITLCDNMKRMSIERAISRIDQGYALIVDFDSKSQLTRFKLIETYQRQSGDGIMTRPF